MPEGAQPNHLLRTAREHTVSPRGPGTTLSRAELAEAVNAWIFAECRRSTDLDAHTIAKYERGSPRWPNEYYRAAFRAVLGAEHDADLGFTPPRRVRRAPITERTTDRVPLSIEGEEQLVSAADESAEFLNEVEETNVGELTVEQLRADVQRLTREYLKTSTLPAFARTRALRNRAFQLLRGHQRPDQSRELYAAAGWALTLLGWMTIDLGKPALAESHARTAWGCATNADHNGLRAWVRATQHTAAFWQGDYERAAQRAADGCRWATGSARTFLTAAYALDLARAGDHQHARTALLDAYDAAETAEPGQDEMAGPFTCGVDRAGSLWSDADIVMGDPDLALTDAEHALDQFSATPRAQRNLGSERMTRLMAVRCYLSLGQLDDAAAALAPVLNVAPELRVRPLVTRMHDIGYAAAQQFGTNPQAADLRGAVAEFIRAADTPALEP